MNVDRAQLNMANLPKFDQGRVEKEFDVQLKMAALHCADMPQEKKPRKVILECHITPEPDPDDASRLDGCGVRFVVKHSLPAKKLNELICMAHKQGLLSFVAPESEGIGESNS